VLDLCRQFHCLPSQLYQEDAELFRMLKIEALGRVDEGGDADVGQ
jgi:hypothetical protein